MRGSVRRWQAGDRTAGGQHSGADPPADVRIREIMATQQPPVSSI